MGDNHVDGYTGDVDDEVRDIDVGVRVHGYVDDVDGYVNNTSHSTIEYTSHRRSAVSKCAQAYTQRHTRTHSHTHTYIFEYIHAYI